MRVTGLFDQFDNLESIQAEDLIKWLKPPHHLITIQNLLANRILYPQSVPVTKQDLEFDLALLREALKSAKVKSFVDQTTKKIIIPHQFIESIPNIGQLVWVFIDAFLLSLPQQKDLRVWTVETARPAKVLGTVIFPKLDVNGEMKFKLDGKDFIIKKGSLVILPCGVHCHLNFQFTNGEILGLKEGAIEIYGGELGLVVDGRQT